MVIGTCYFSSCGGSGCGMLKGEDQEGAGQATGRIPSTTSDRPFSLPPISLLPTFGVPQEHSGKRLLLSPPLSGVPPAGCPPFGAGGEPAATAGRWRKEGGPGSRHPHLFHFEPCGSSLQAGRSAGSRPATEPLGGTEGRGGRRGHPSCPRPFAALHFAARPPPALPFAALQRHKAQLPAVPRCHEMHQVEIQSPRCVCGRTLWQLLRNFL